MANRGESCWWDTRGFNLLISCFSNPISKLSKPTQTLISFTTLAIQIKNETDWIHSFTISCVGRDAKSNAKSKVPTSRIRSSVRDNKSGSTWWYFGNEELLEIRWWRKDVILNGYYCNCTCITPNLDPPPRKNPVETFFPMASLSNVNLLLARTLHCFSASCDRPKEISAILDKRSLEKLKV